jgi:inner membrane protein
MSIFFPILGDWFWWAAAGLLLILELSMPGIFFIWLAIAAATVGVIAIFVQLGWQMELLLFAALSLVSVFAGRRLLTRRHAFDSEIPNLNRRMYDYVGKTFPLAEPIVDGRGRVSIDGTLWDIVGPDTPKGARVRVTGVEGLKLTVLPQ